MKTQMTRTWGATGERARVKLLLLAFFLAGCGYYSFSGASIPPELNTIAIPLAELEAATPLPTLPDELTRLLTDRFVRQTRLRLEPDEASADAVLQARITGYRNEPTAVGDDRAQRTRVTIDVQVRYGADSKHGGPTPGIIRSSSGETSGKIKSLLMKKHGRITRYASANYLMCRIISW